MFPLLLEWDNTIVTCRLLKGPYFLVDILVLECNHNNLKTGRLESTDKDLTPEELDHKALLAGKGNRSNLNTTGICESIIYTPTSNKASDYCMII